MIPLENETPVNPLLSRGEFTGNAVLAGYDAFKNVPDEQIKVHKTIKDRVVRLLDTGPLQESSATDTTYR
ncbi:MAG: hypothetical protein LBS81_03785 [Endomicrobium sp.]|jgi:hypothetical protein|nr:hypothetical protein [Endomicrobium sp.]